MKILQVIPYFTPERGGDVKVCYNLSKWLAKCGHEVTIISTDFEFDEKYAKSNKDVTVVTFKSIQNVCLFLYSPSMKKWLRNNIKNFDVIHMHNFRSYQNNVIHKYAKKYKIPFVLQAHGSVMPFFARQRLKNIYDLFWGYELLKDASKIIALTETEVEQYKSMGVDAGKIEIVPNGIDLSKYNNLPKRGEFKKRYSLIDDEEIVLYLGRLHKSKGIDLLVNAFADLIKELYNVRLVLVGPDEGYRATLEKLVQSLKIDEKVLFTGFVSPSEKRMALVDADVFVTPRFSGFPMTFLESCACRTPIITTTEGDELNWIHDKVGYVVKYDRDQLRDAIFKVLSDEGVRRKFGEGDKMLESEGFGYDKIIKRIEGIYLNCLQNKRGPN